MGTHDLIIVAALCTIDEVPSFLEDNLAVLLHATELPDRLREGSHSVVFDALGQVRSAPAADLMERHALDARTALEEGDGAGAASEAGQACGVLADLAVFAHVIEGERHHDDYERWVETAVQRGSEAWEDVIEPGGLQRVKGHTKSGIYIDEKGRFIIYPWDVRPTDNPVLPEGFGPRDATIELARETWVDAWEIDQRWNSTGEEWRAQAVRALTRAVEATAKLLMWMSPQRMAQRIPFDRDTFRTVVVAGFGVNLIFIAVWPGRWRLI